MAKFGVFDSSEQWPCCVSTNTQHNDIRLFNKQPHWKNNRTLILASSAKLLAFFVSTSTLLLHFLALLNKGHTGSYTGTEWKLRVTGVLIIGITTCNLCLIRAIFGLAGLCGPGWNNLVLNVKCQYANMLNQPRNPDNYHHFRFVIMSKLACSQ